MAKSIRDYNVGDRFEKRNNLGQIVTMEVVEKTTDENGMTYVRCVEVKG